MMAGIQYEFYDTRVNIFRYICSERERQIFD